MAKRSAVRHRLNVVFDTNTLYTRRVDDLVSEAAAEMIKANSSHVDIEIVWTVPEMVVRERENQMLEEARTHVTALNKIERLLGTNWGVTEETLALHVRKAIEKRMEALGLVMRSCDPTRVDWPRITERAARRLPPFEKGSTEKGFKDAVIGETFLQLMNDWLAADVKNKAILVTSDGLLRDSLADRLPNGTRVRVLPDLQEVRNEINILGSSVDEAFAAELVTDATKLFWEPDNRDCFWKKEGISKTIMDKYPDRFTWTPDNADRGELKRVRIGRPIFIEKTARRVKFSSKVTFHFEGVSNPHEVVSRPDLPTGFYGSGVQDSISGSGIPINSLLNYSKANADSFASFKTGAEVLAALANPTTYSGKIEFDVSWDASLLRSKKLSSPHLIDVSIVSDTWTPIDL